MATRAPRTRRASSQTTCRQAGAALASERTKFDEHLESIPSVCLHPSRSRRTARLMSLHRRRADGRTDPRCKPSTKAQSEGLAQRLLASARRQQEALVGTISSLLRGCSSRNHKPSRELKLSAAASSRSEPSRDSTVSETGAVATLVAFGHGGQSHEVPPCPATSQSTCLHLACPHHAHLRLAGHVLFQAQAGRRPRRERAAHARALHG